MMLGSHTDANREMSIDLYMRELKLKYLRDNPVPVWAIFWQK